MEQRIVVTCREKVGLKRRVVVERKVLVFFFFWEREGGCRKSRLGFGTFLEALLMKWVREAGVYDGGVKVVEIVRH